MRALIPLSLVIVACNPDLPRRCKPSDKNGVAALVSFQYGTEDDPATEICVDMYPASRPDATATSPGLDESYATSRPGVIPWTNVTFAEAALACGRGGRFLCNVQEAVATGDYKEDPPGFTGQVDSVPIAALRPTSTDEAEDAPDARILITDVARGIGIPDYTGSVVFWASDHVITGRVRNEFAESGRAHFMTRVWSDTFKHPLVGFRCCIDARLESAFKPLGHDDSRVRTEVDPEVVVEAAP